jgi:hypothetical protein
VKVHDFADSLAESRRWIDAPWWEPVYRRAFRHYAGMHPTDDPKAQRAGIDRLVSLADGTMLYVDEKVREKDWPDILAEIWSDEARRIPGWANDAKQLACDYIAYAFIPTQRCYLLPHRELVRAVREHDREWWAKCETEQDGFRLVRAHNRGWITTSMAVPTAIMLDAIRDVMVVTWP